MKIRIVSDLHLDVNEKYPFELRDKDTFTVICGDTSGDPDITNAWIDENLKGGGVFVAGNHLVYNRKSLPITELRKLLTKNHTENDPVTYLDCMVPGGCFSKRVNGIQFIGTTLYTDFLLRVRHFQTSPEITRSSNMKIAKSRMNDFRWGISDSLVDGEQRPLRPEEYLEAFMKSFAMIEREVERLEREEPEIPVFILTHYCPSIRCISDTYNDSEVNASYVSNLSDFILKHKNIKCWSCGHVHHQDSFYVGDCLVVMNPRGYVTRCEDAGFRPNLYVDSDTWTLVKPDLTKEEKQDYKQRLDAYSSVAAWFW